MGKEQQPVLWRWYRIIVLVFSVGCSSAFGVLENTVPFPVLYWPEFARRPVLFSGGKTIAEVVMGDDEQMLHCRLYELEELSDADPILKNSGLEVRYAEFRPMLDLINNCTKLEKPTPLNTTATNNNTVEEEGWSAWSLWNGILPGTKWCGVGDIAESFEQLGKEVDVDACCRAHDHCPVKLKAFRAGYGLINLSLYTKSHCDCDREFFSCLKSSANRMADAVGNFYFNVIKVQCLKDRREFICLENRTDIGGFNTCNKWGPDPDSNNMQVSISQIKY